MFLLRAAFWLAAVVVLMPREPDLGMAPGLVRACEADAGCSGPARWLKEFRATAIASLARVREDLEAARRG
jgi:hypothetical protein